MHTIFQCMFALVAHVSSANMQRPEESVEVVRAGVLRQYGHRPEGDMVDVWEVLQCADNTVGLPFCQIPGTILRHGNATAAASGEVICVGA